MLDAQNTPGLQKVQGLPDHRAADAQAQDQLALGRETLARIQAARYDHLK
jgi:hypothetical protein